MSHRADVHVRLLLLAKASRPVRCGELFGVACATPGRSEAGDPLPTESRLLTRVRGRTQPATLSMIVIHAPIETGRSAKYIRLAQKTG